MPADVVGVVGAGLMGAEIALVFALAGHQVKLADLDEATLKRAVERMDRTLARGVERKFYSAEMAASAKQKISLHTNIAELADVALVTEAVFERLDVKSDVLRSLDQACAPSTIIATNTSTIPISTLAAAVSDQRKPRFVGTHYFSPASRMALVEVIPAFETSEAIVTSLVDWLTRVGKRPIRVKDVAGFAVNRLLHVFVIEAVRLIEEGVATPEEIDIACRMGLGHPMGPFELMDATTSSLCLQVQEILHDAYGERFRPRPLLKQRVEAGLVGGKGRPGWRTAKPKTTSS